MSYHLSCHWGRNASLALTRPTTRGHHKLRAPLLRACIFSDCTPQGDTLGHMLFCPFYIFTHTSEGLIKCWGTASMQCLWGTGSLVLKMLNRICSWFLFPVIHTILFLVLSLSSFKNSLRVNSSNCFLTERKAQPDECFLCSSLEKTIHEHVNRDSEVEGEEFITTSLPPHLRDTLLCFRSRVGILKWMQPVPRSTFPHSSSQHLLGLWTLPIPILWLVYSIWSPLASSKKSVRV